MFSCLRSSENPGQPTSLYRRIKIILILTISISSSFHVNAQEFTEQTGISLTGVEFGSVAWGDYNNDGDLDILLTGDSGTDYVSNIYKNNGDNTFTEQTGISLTGVTRSSVAWGDYDNDGDLDILLTGDSGTGYVSKIYKNNGDNTFTEQTQISLTPVRWSSVAWGDYDNDGDLDILLTGDPGSGRVSKVYKNNGDNTFTEQTGISLTGVESGSVAWGDYDNDGDLDILLTGYYTSKIYKNNGDNTFTEQTGISLTGVNYSSIDWGDYDNDGDLDILLTGALPGAGADKVSKVYKNNGNNSFTEQTGIALTGYYTGSAAWGDYNNDGYLDIFLTGGGSLISKIYKNNGDNTFTEQTGISLIGTFGGSAAWGDYDNDGDLDVLLTGYSGGTYVAKIYQNNSTVSNTVPSAPTGLKSFWSADSVVLSWNKSVDNETPQDGLTYNAYLYSENGDTIWNSMSNIHTGYRRIPAIGNAQHDTSWTIKNLNGGQYYWGVQAIDHSFAGSPFSNKSGFNNSIIELTGISLTGVTGSCVSWGDYDNDGDLDILLSGNTGSGYVSKIYNNDGNNAFIEQTGISLTGISGSVAWGDYDNDGDLDIILSGHTGTGWIAKIYKNNGDNTFTLQNGISLTGVYSSSVAWGDYDNDGDLDILLSGGTFIEDVSKIYKNNGDNTFTEQTGILLTGVEESCGSWADYDDDGDLDILLSGYDSDETFQAVSKIYKNNGDNTFTEQTGITLIGVRSPSTAWGDYDNDGDLDILLTGSEFSKIYRNNGDNSFTEQTGISLTGVSAGSVAWGDYDNDGDLDILLTGYHINGTMYYVSKIYNNNGNNTFTELTDVSLPGIRNGSVAWGDCDNDGDLDILLSGDTGSGYISKIYRNDIYKPNILPTEPIYPYTINSEDNVLFHWMSASDTETPAGALSYNLRVGTSMGEAEIVSPHSNNISGFRRVVSLGNAQQNNFYILKGYADSIIYWSVQSVDQGFAGSQFTTEKIYPFIGQDIIDLEGMEKGSASWGDYDNDNDLDVIITGTDNSISPASSIYQNTGIGTFIKEGLINLTPLSLSSSAWGDFDNDGDLDIIMTGRNEFSTKTSILYQNNGSGNFIRLNDVNFIDAENGSISWGDYDNDGDLDLILCGSSDHGRISEIYQNNGNNDFSILSSANLTGVDNSFTAWEDYDNDGDLDILLLGTSDGGRVTEIYNNEGNGIFTEQASITLPGIQNGFASFGDYDGDGNADLLIAGNGETGSISRIFKNNGDNTFTALSDTILPGIQDCSGSWIDYDNDGDLDIVLSGESDEGRKTYFYQTIYEDTFVKNLVLEGVSNSSTAVGDYNNDGKMDLLVTGRDPADNYVSKIYKNNDLSANTKPSTPGGLSSVVSENNVTLSWDKSTDTETPQDGLSYNLYLYKEGGDTILSSMSNTADGFKKIPSPGNARQNNSWEIQHLSAGTYYWSVQAVDQAFEGSGFAPESSFVIKSFLSQDIIDLTGVSDGCVRWGDYDNDKDLDILLTGYYYDGTDHYVADIYENNGSGNFAEDQTISLPGVRFSSAAWWDYNNDGNLDIILTGLSQTGRISKIFSNTGSGSFIEETSIVLPGVSNGAVAAGDYNNDGYEDLLLSGNTGSGRVTNIYLNNSQGGFIEQPSITIPGIDNSAVQWGDYDNDADLDVLVTGNTDGGAASMVFRNEGDGSFAEQSSLGLTGVTYSTALWGDYNSDGNLDILITGLSGSGPVSMVYGNNGDGSFTEQVSFNLEGVQKGSSAWGDYDSDGDLDILITGSSDTGEVSLIYHNIDGSNFVLDEYSSLTDIRNSSVACGDYDGDGDLDITLSGLSGGSYITKVYKNNAYPLNTHPQSPSGLSSNVIGKSVTVNWDRATDTETWQGGLMYNVYLFKQDGDTVMSSMSHNISGFRKIPGSGNVQLDTLWIIDSLEYGKYFWNVQTIDNSYIGSGFAVRDSFEIATPLPFVSDVSVCYKETVPKLEAAGENIQWYSDASLLTLVFSGNSFAAGKTEPGIYTYYATQTIDNYVSKASEVSLTIKPLPESPAANDSDICYGEGPANLTASGTVLKWYDDAFLSNLVNNGPIFETGLTNIGIYTYYVTQTENSCEGKPDTVTLSINSLPAATVSDDTIVCSGVLRTIGAEPVTGNTYSWTSSQGDLTSSEANPEVHPASPGTYKYFLTETIDDTGCKRSDSVTIQVNPSPVIEIIADTNSIDQGGSTNLNATGADTYSWSPATGLSSTSGSQVNASPTEITTYFLEGTNQFGCKDYDTIVLYVYCDACGQEAPYYNTEGTFNFGCTNHLYRNNLNCSWTLLPSGVGNIYLRFIPEEFDVRTGDWIWVHDGLDVSADTIGRYNNDKMPPAVIQGGSSLYIRFTTNESGTGKGFQAEWSNDPSIGINEISGGSFRIYPNPTNDILYIEWTSRTTENVRINIYNNRGQLIRLKEIAVQPGPVREEFNLKELKPAIYYLEIKSEDQPVRRIIIKE